MSHETKSKDQIWMTRSEMIKDFQNLAQIFAEKCLGFFQINQNQNIPLSKGWWNYSLWMINETIHLMKGKKWQRQMWKMTK